MFNFINSTKDSHLNTLPCKIPFINAEIALDGNVCTCCSTFLNIKTTENIVDNDFNEIWNSPTLNELRSRVLNGDYSMCRRDLCCSYTPCSSDDIPSDYKNGPKVIKLSYDSECNNTCITCRDCLKINTPEQNLLYDNIYLPKIINLAKNAEIIGLSGSGDPLFSKHSRNVIKELIKHYPKIKFNLYTNGYLLNEKTINDLGISNNLFLVAVSVDAATRETYRKILRRDAFNIIMKNLKYISELKKQGKIDTLMLNFVVHLMNYKEMADFVKLAKKFDAMAYFSTYTPWHTTEYDKQYDNVAVFEPKNKYYKDFVKILKNSVFNDKEHCLLEPRLQNLSDI